MRRVCLLLHGYTGGPHEMWPLAEALADDGYTVVVPTLKGHDRSPQHMRDVHYADWVKDVERNVKAALRHTGEIDLVGFSMGGLLAAYAANRYRVRRLVLISAAIIYVSPGRFAREMAEMVRKQDFAHFAKARRTPLVSTLQFVRLARKLRREIGQLKVPTLIVQGDQDQIVHPASARWIYNRIDAPKELVIVPGAKHVVCQDPQAEPAIRAVRRFLNRP